MRASFLAILVLGFVAAQTSGLPYNWCMKPTKAALDAIRTCIVKLEVYPWDFYHDFPDVGYSDKCFSQCQLEVQNMVKEDGDYDEVAIQDALGAMAKLSNKSEEAVRNFTLDCVQKTRAEYASVGGMKAKPCESGAFVLWCLIENDAKLCD